MEQSKAINFHKDRFMLQHLIAKKSLPLLLSASSPGYVIFSCLTQSHHLRQCHKSPPIKLCFSNYITNQENWNDETTLINWYDRTLLPLNQWKTESDFIGCKKSRRSCSYANSLRLPRSTPSKLLWNHKIALVMKFPSHEENQRALTSSHWKIRQQRWVKVKCLCESECWSLGDFSI